MKKPIMREAYQRFRSTFAFDTITVLCDKNIVKRCFDFVQLKETWNDRWKTQTRRDLRNVRLKIVHNWTHKENKTDTRTSDKLCTRNTIAKGYMGIENYFFKPSTTYVMCRERYTHRATDPTEIEITQY